MFHCTFGSCARSLLVLCAALLAPGTHAFAQQQVPPPAPPAQSGDATTDRDRVFDMGEIVVVGTPRDSPASAARC